MHFTFHGLLKFRSRSYPAMAAATCLGGDRGLLGELVVKKSSRPADSTVALIRKIAQVQGAIFLKDLLRQKRKDGERINLGGSKQEVLETLEQAVRDNVITETDVRSWINQTEGWGRQHVYLYRASEAVCKRRMWSSPAAFEKAVRNMDISIPRPSAHWLAFPEQLTLAELTFDGTQLQVVWHQASSQEERDTDLDFSDEVDGDPVNYRAYRQLPKRIVMRFVLHPSERRGGLFVQFPLGDDHDAAVKSAHTFLGQMLSKTALETVRLSESIKDLDQAHLQAPGSHAALIQPRNTRLRSRGASVEFSAEATLDSYTSVAAVRRVRRAVVPREFSGDSGKFTIDLSSATGLKRKVKMSMNAAGNRVYLYAQMTGGEVWDVVSHILDARQ